MNRLRSVRHNGTLVVRYGYDVLGRGIAKRVWPSAKAEARHAVAEATAPSTFDVPALSTGYDYCTVKDKLGSIRALAERDGTWKYSASYGPYGEPDTESGTDPGLRYRWTGREYDTETGWYFHRTRYYSPTMLRFVQEDKIGYGGGANLYAYVGGAVLEARDPSGMLASWVDIGRGFIPFCTRGGSCMGADGSVTGGGPEIWVDGVRWGGGGGGGGISGIGSITGRGFGSLLPTVIRFDQLSKRERAAVVAAIAEIQDASVRSQLERMLQSGTIVAGTDFEKAYLATIWGVPDLIVGYRKNPSGVSVFDFPTANLAFGFAHEVGHLRQVLGRNPIGIAIINGWINEDSPTFNRSFSDALEARANAFACGITTPILSFTSYCN